VCEVEAGNNEEIGGRPRKHKGLYLGKRISCFLHVPSGKSFKRTHYIGEGTTGKKGDD